MSKISFSFSFEKKTNKCLFNKGNKKVSNVTKFHKKLFFSEKYLFMLPSEPIIRVCEFSQFRGQRKIPQFPRNPMKFKEFLKSMHNHHQFYKYLIRTG